MKSENIDTYIKKNNLPLRRYGKNAPIGKYTVGIIWWQSLTRMWLERKNLYRNNYYFLPHTIHLKIKINFN